MGQSNTMRSSPNSFWCEDYIHIIESMNLIAAHPKPAFWLIPYVLQPWRMFLILNTKSPVALHYNFFEPLKSIWLLILSNKTLSFPLFRIYSTIGRHLPHRCLNRFIQIPSKHGPRYAKMSYYNPSNGNNQTIIKKSWTLSWFLSTLNIMPLTHNHIIMSNKSKEERIRYVPAATSGETRVIEKLNSSSSKPPFGPRIHQLFLV